MSRYAARPHYLTVTLRGRFRWLADDIRGSVILLAPSGLHVELDEAYVCCMHPIEASRIGAALLAALDQGQGGFCTLVFEATITQDGQKAWNVLVEPVRAGVVPRLVGGGIRVRAWRRTE